MYNYNFQNDMIKLEFQGCGIFRAAVSSGGSADSPQRVSASNFRKLDYTVLHGWEPSASGFRHSEVRQRIEQEAQSLGARHQHCRYRIEFGQPLRTELTMVVEHCWALRNVINITNLFSSKTRKILCNRREI